jgi:hypothetical protein
MNAIYLKLEYKNYSNTISILNKTYSKKYNLYNTLMFCIKSIKQNNKENLKEGLKILFKDFHLHIDSLIYVIEYSKLKKCTSYDVYCELLLYFKSFKENRIDNELNFKYD